MGFRHRATVFRCRGVVGRICPRENAPLGEGLPTRRASERICPAQEHAPRQRPPDTAHERKDLPRVRRLSSAKASRHGARAKEFARAETLPSAKASRHGARAKEFAPRENAPLGEGLPTRRTSERICPAGERSPRRRPPDTAHEQKNLPRRGTLSSAKASRHGARAKGFAPQGNALLGEGLSTRRTGERICPAGFAFAPRADERRAALDRRTAGKTPLRRGRTREGAAAAEFIHRKK